MATQLYSYSLIKSLYDQGDDVIDSFWPLVLKVLPTDRSAGQLETVQVAIEQKYGLSIPQHSLGTIITRAARKGLVDRRENNISLTQNGADFYYRIVELERQAERRVNELLVDANEFLKSNRQFGFSSDKIKETIQTLVLENLEVLEQFFNPEHVQTKEKSDSPTEAEKLLFDYFVTVERTKPAIFRTLQDIVCGSILSATLHTSEQLEGRLKRFERTAVYLDSDYIFSLLGLRYDEENKPAQELFELMKQEAAFEFKVFDFTIHEITNLLRNYEKEERYYQPHIKVRGSLFASLKGKGWNPAKVEEFVVNLEGVLWHELGVTISPTDVNLKTYEPDDSKRRALLAGYKAAQGIKEQNHDLAAIDQIRFRRRKPVRQMQRCQALFLTSDMNLALYNYIGEEHKENETISEVIPDRLLTNILWLRNPGVSGGPSLDSIIALHSRSMFVDQTVWKQFYKNVVKLRSEESLDDRQVSLLFYDSYTQNVLTRYDSDEAEQIDPIVILRAIRYLRGETENHEPLAIEPGASVLDYVSNPDLLDAPVDDLIKRSKDLRERVVTSRGETPIYVDENVQFTVYRPRKLKPEKWYTLLAYAHLSERAPDRDEFDPIERMQEEVKRILGEQKLKSYRPTTEDSSQGVPRKGELTFLPFMEGVEFNPPSRSFLWQESVHGQEFRMRASLALDGKTARGQMSVFLGAILLAEVNLSIKVDSQSAAADDETHKHEHAVSPYRRIFPSYSHKDVEIVAQVEEYAQLTGDKYMRDVKELRSGQNWKQWMKNEIAKADIFQLFWSTNSMRSENVRLEWEHALALKRHHFIRPTYWENPLPESRAENLPPPELRDLHFQPLRLTSKLHPETVTSAPVMIGRYCVRCGAVNEASVRYCSTCHASLPSMGGYQPIQSAGPSTSASKPMPMWLQAVIILIAGALLIMVIALVVMFTWSQ